MIIGNIKENVHRIPPVHLCNFCYLELCADNLVIYIYEAIQVILVPCEICFAVRGGYIAAPIVHAAVYLYFGRAVIGGILKSVYCYL